MQEPTFNPPYGGANQHVTDPAKHHGYLHLVAWSVHLGSYSEYIEGRCAEAKAAGAPADVIYERSGPGGVRTGEWVRFSSIETDTRDRAHSFVSMQEYVDELVHFQHARRKYHARRKTLPPFKLFTVTLTVPLTTTVTALNEEDARRSALAGWAQSPDGTATARLSGPPGAWVANFNGIPTVEEARR
ncbi:hypothetical protein [Kitasatospora sp. NPDC087315]|uniref:hypothetical protein n=1 Tax=Kitasatospora sp. NPDC087315 TaxID=3364069 RepID=UPI0038276E39